jgi:hypothetical protein
MPDLPPMAMPTEYAIPTNVQQPQQSSERDLELEMILYGDKYMKT